MSPSAALSRVLLPAPLGPMRPRIRPSSSLRSTPSSAVVAPNVLRNPFASMHAMVSALRYRAGRKQLLRRQAEALDGSVDVGPLFGHEALALGLEQQVARAGIDEHAEPAALLDDLLVGELLIGLEHRQRIDAEFGGDVPDRGQGIAFVEYAVEDHGNDPIAQLPIDRLMVVPGIVHCGFQLALVHSVYGQCVS